MDTFCVANMCSMWDILLISVGTVIIFMCNEIDDETLCPFLLFNKIYE